MKHFLSSLLLVLMLSGFKPCNGMENMAAVQGDYSTDIRCEKWKAMKIGRQKENLEARSSPIAYFRREFILDKLSATAVIHLSADPSDHGEEILPAGFLYPLHPDLSYKLYVNGTFVGDGPPRITSGAAGVYCSYDITSLLEVGANVLAVMVYSKAGHPNLIGQLEFRDTHGKITGMIVTDDSWKALDSPWMKLLECYRGVADDCTEVYDGRSEPTGWKRAGFNDTEWEVIYSSPSGNMEASILPHYIRRGKLPQRIMFTGEVTDLINSFISWPPPGIQMAMEIPLASKHTKVINPGGLTGENSATAIVENEVDVHDQASYDAYWDKYDDMPMMRAATIILDFGEIANGFVEIDIEGAPGTVVDIGWGQTLMDGRVHTMPRFFGRLMTFASRYYHGGGRRKWETYHWQSFRYLQLTVRNQSGPVKLHRVAAVRSSQPLDERGSFHCSDPFLDKLFVSSGKTLRAASYDVFMDNTIREKSAWGGDIADGSVMSCLSVFGDVPMLRYYFKLFEKSQKFIGTGNLPAIANATGTQYPGHNMRTAIQMAEYGFWCNDPGYYKETLFPVLERFLDYMDSRVENRGLWTVMEGETDWVDHVLRDQCDISIPINLLYLHLLNRTSEVAVAYDEGSGADKYLRRAERIRKAVYNDFWDPDAGLYRDGSYRGELCPTFSTHANYLALLCNLGREGRQERILGALRDPANTGNIIDFGAPFFAWPPAGLFETGEDQAALDLIRKRYERFFRNPDGGDTFWEEESWALRNHRWDPLYRSLAQNGAGSPAWFLLSEVLGVKPFKPGFAEFIVEPKPCDLAWARGVVPSPSGDIEISWEREDAVFSLSLEVPPGTVAAVVLPENGRVTVNNRPLDKSRLKVSREKSFRRVNCPAGNYTFNFKW